MKIPFSISIRGLLVVTMIIFLVVIVYVERQRTEDLTQRLGVLDTIASRPILEQELVVKKMELQLEFARNSLESQSSSQDFLTDDGMDLETDATKLVAPVGLRRELANLRNIQLKLSREKAKLDVIKKEFETEKQEIESRHNKTP